MTEYERGYRDALEAAALIVQTAPVQIDGSTTGPMQNLASAILGTFRPGIVAAIRALAPRIPPAPDDEAISRLVAASEAPAGCDGLGEVRVRVSDLRGALNALREAGALRHE